jgi:hypothetical protein
MIETALCEHHRMKGGKDELLESSIPGQKRSDPGRS